MQGHTHALFGLVTLAAVQTVTPLVQPHLIAGFPAGAALCAGAAILGALAPDIDAEESTIKHELGGAGTVASGGLGLAGVKHRGLTHYGLTAGLALAAAWLIGRQFGYGDVGLAFGLGYLSHILADAMTKQGVPLWGPLPGQFHLLPKALCMRTGSPAETLLFMALVLVLGRLGPALLPPAWLKSLERFI
ncbi:MAG: metal-dependent hydrolase [Anaerolineae bacterium]|nr:metal-dependent hydrolase [Anaerolineae bacterium]